MTTHWGLAAIICFNSLWLHSAEPWSSIEITIPESSIRSLETAPKEYAKCRVVQGQESGAAEVRLKGHGTFAGIHSNASFALKPARTNQTFGFTKIFLNNARQDPSYLREVLGYQSFRQSGVPAPECFPVALFVNGRYAGVRVLVEAQNKSMLQKWFFHNEGNLYEGESRDIDQMLAQDSGAVIDQKDRLQLLRDHEFAHLDVTEAARYFAVEMLLGHWDGYIGNQNNYRLYHTGERFVLLPHGLDTIFRPVNWSLQSASRGILAQRVFIDRGASQEYLRNLTALVDSSSLARIMKSTAQARAQIQSILLKYEPENLARWKGQCRVLFDAITNRLELLSRETAAFDETRLQSISQSPNAWSFARGNDGATGTKTNQTLSAIGSWTNSAGTWRLPVFLLPGRCCLEVVSETEAADDLECVTRLLVRGQYSTREGTSHSGQKLLRFSFEVTAINSSTYKTPVPEEVLCRVEGRGKGTFDLKTFKISQCR